MHPMLRETGRILKTRYDLDLVLDPRKDNSGGDQRQGEMLSRG
jgi:hypothetical protein